jgi:Ca-activated chloride channel homolog
MSNPASALTGPAGERVALCDVRVTAALRDLLAEVTVSQTYRNDESINIEAVYTFPLPLDAVLLDLEVHIGGRVLKAVVVEKKAAEERYEDAVQDGDAAVMLQAIEPGLYTMNVGNLLPQESATITFRYAMLYRWSGDRLRIFLPTTIAPRYGDSLHQPQQVPEHSLTVENEFSLSVEVFGALRDAQFDCPSHSVALKKLAECTVLSLAQSKAVMDRDFILNVKAPQATRSFALTGQDGEGQVVLASFQPFFPGLRQAKPLNLAIVIDCSGSMGGDSIEQAKQAIESILDGLQGQDRVSMIAFGSTTKTLADRPLVCTKTNLAKAQQFAQALDADMGGTEIGDALQKAYAVAGRDGVADIFLVTDGEVSQWDKVVSDAKDTRHRVFTVGVGSAVSEAFVRELAAVTGGGCELVSPSEGMADRVVRHFERMRAPRAQHVVVRWPEGVTDVGPARTGAVFDGDSVVAWARFNGVPVQGEAILEVKTEQHEVFRQAMEWPAPLPSAEPDGFSTVARVAAAARLKEQDGTTGLETALRYRLLSPWTNWLVVAPRDDDDKPLDLPLLRKVPQSLAAGWGGTGSVVMSSAAISFCAIDPGSTVYSASLTDMLIPESVAGDANPLDGLPPAHRRLIELIESDPSKLRIDGALDLLGRSGAMQDFDDLFRRAADLGLEARTIASILLARLLVSVLAEYLSEPAKHAAQALQDRVAKATNAIWEIGRLARAFDTQMGEPTAQELIRDDRFRDVLRRLAHLPGLLEHVDHAMSRPVERSQKQAAQEPSFLRVSAH